MKLRPSVPSRSAACLVAGLVLAGCGGGSGGDKPTVASALVSPVSDSASAVAAEAVVTSADAASEPASAASTTAPDPTVKIQAASVSPSKTGTSTGTVAVGATPSASPTAISAAVTSASAQLVSGSAPSAQATPTATSISTTTASVSPATTSTTSSTTGATTKSAVETAVLGAASGMTSLAAASTNTAATTTVSTTSSACKVAYVAPDSLVTSTPAPRPSGGGVFYSNAELAVWKARLTTGPFVKANDFTKGSPGDWERINLNATEFIKNGDKGPQDSSATDEFSRLGTGARDAAFLFLMTANGAAFTAVREYLITQSRNPVVDFPTRLCLTDKNNWNPDGYYYQASWLLRYMVTYDYVRSALASSERVAIENFIRRNAYMLATQMDNALAKLFPNRLAGDYSKKLWVATAPKGVVSWWSKRYDTNNDCKVDGNDTVAAQAVYAYVRSDGVLGPRLSELSQFYNNRRAATSLTYGAAGLVLGDPVLIASAKRYTFEWLTYGVWPDGSQGEYARNGDYCIPQQGVIYGAANTASAALLAALLTRQGDTSIQSFSTRDGLFGSESAATAPAKTLELVVNTQLGLINGSIKWFFHQPWRSKQDLTDANAMTGFRSYYMKSTKPLENYHELGLLPAAAVLPGTKITGMVMRDKAVTSLPFPGATGNSVTTGWGNWTDPFNALPAPLLMRP